MLKPPSLFSLCIDVATTEIIHGGSNNFNNIFELPAQLFESLVSNLPPLALHIVQNQMSFESGSEFGRDGFKNGKKRGRYGDFDAIWKTYYKLRWPDGVSNFQSANRSTKTCLLKLQATGHDGNWDQLYWEAHIQCCLENAAEVALLPSFNGCIGKIAIPGCIMQSIGYKSCTCNATCEYSMLSYHCQQFSHFVRSLKLQNALCVLETSALLKHSKLETLVFQNIKNEHVHGVCILVNQNCETVSSLEFNYCKLTSTAVSAICNSVYTNGIKAHGIQNFSIIASSITGEREPSLPSGLISFLLSGRSLCSIKFCDNDLGLSFAKALWNALLNASCPLSMLDLSENNISGWLSSTSGAFSNSPVVIGRSLQLLSVLNLRGNNINDINELKFMLAKMPNLLHLDISDNPIGDDGVRNLMAYFSEAPERDSRLSDLKLDGCNLSCSGVTQLLASLSSLKNPLNSLSIAENNLGSQVAVALGEFIGKSLVKVINAEDIELGPSGFLALGEELSKGMKLVHINISKNRGGIQTASLVRKFILQAPDLVVVNAGYNFMPSQSLAIICSALKISKGKLEQIDLTGNSLCYQPTLISSLQEFQFRGRPIVVFRSMPTEVSPYDDDP